MLISTDLRTISAEAKQILLNKEVIAVNQDPLAKAGSPVLTLNDSVIAYKRELSAGSFAVAVLNAGDQAVSGVSVSLSQLGIQGSFTAKELWTKDVTKSVQTLSGDIPSHGTLMFKLTPQKVI
jgi:alpha-galactosidase